MTGIAPGQPAAPGIAAPGTYPVWGIGGGSPGSPAGWNIVEAQTAARQYAYEQQGYLVWYSTKSAAQAGISSQSSPYGSGQPLTGVAAIGGFFSALGEASTWIRVAEVIIGVILLAVGVAHLTRAVPAATRIAAIA